MEAGGALKVGGALDPTGAPKLGGASGGLPAGRVRRV